MSNKLQQISSSTSIGNEFVGIYNNNNKLITTDINILYQKIIQLENENKLLRSRVDELSSKVSETKLKQLEERIQELLDRNK